MAKTKPDNNVDELDEILTGLANYIVESIQLQPTPVEYKKLNQRQAKKAIEDFYRNKIPKKRDMFKITKKTVTMMPSAVVGYNQAIDDITAQFNSKGDSDE